MLTISDCTKETKFEQALAYHCAPAMAGIKAADLFSWLGTPEETQMLIAVFAERMKQTGICFQVLRYLKGRSLILVYRRSCLEKQLAQPDVRRLLRRDGYPVEEGLVQMLAQLSRRMKVCAEFPHEVGLFLGYPVEDVEGFRKHDGRDFKFCGLWKVYANEEQARECFRRYHCCRSALCRRVESGCHLGQIFRAA